MYEGNDWPEYAGWTALSHCNPGRALVDGCFEQEVTSCPDHDPPGGQQESFERSLVDFVDYDTFFLEWRMVTDGPGSEIVGVAPASIVAAGSFGTNYHFTIARDQVRLIRDNQLPILMAPFVADVPHTFRLELYGSATYRFYIDDLIQDEGVPEGVYPLDGSAALNFRAKSWFEPSTTRWDYIRYGVIPQDASGDYDSDTDVTRHDFYFVQECLSSERAGMPGGPYGSAGPGCSFADFDHDADVDLLDFAEFQLAFTGSP